MLTSTYTLVALSVEQTSARAALHALLEELQVLPGQDPGLPAERTAVLCGMLRRVYDDCHWRKLDRFLVPALRCHTGAADALLDDLEALSSRAAEAMVEAEGAISADAAPVAIAGAGFLAAALRSVEALLLRLEREEQELFPLARSAVGNDAWFALAKQMMAHDAHARERRAMPRTPGTPGTLGPPGLAAAAERMQGESARRHQALSAAH